jgi:nitrate/nitrite transport system permease protein
MNNWIFKIKAAAISLVILAIFLAVWQVSTMAGSASSAASVQQDEYAALMGKTAEVKASGFPSPKVFFETSIAQLSEPFYDRGPNDKGIGIQLAHSLWRVALGYLIAMLVAIPLGFLIGMSPLLYQALNPFIQILKPISPLAWMPLALYTIKDSNISGIFVIFICSIWPMLINTAFGVAGVRKEWLNVAKTLEVGPFRKAFIVIFQQSSPVCESQWVLLG